MLREWSDLPEFMRIPEVKPYYKVLKKKKGQLLLKRMFDIIVSLLLLAILGIPMLAIAVWIKLDSEGPVMFRQARVTAYGKIFRIHKFRTMVNHADKIGTGVTVMDDARITRVGRKLRHARLDELPQLFDVLSGNMSFVGTRPETAKYVEKYQKEYYATLLLPAGITSEASIRYKDENRLLKDASNVDQIYIEKILPAKMRYNLDNICYFCLSKDFLVMIKTIAAVFEKDK